MRYGNYQFLCSVENEALLPEYKGSTFRGVFGHALKHVVCALKRQDCKECILKERCVYALVFETSDVAKVPGGMKISSLPHPFVIEPPLTTQTLFSEGMSFDFTLLLFGEVNDSLPYFIYAFDRMGKMGIGSRIDGRGQFSLKAVKTGGEVIYSDADQVLRNRHEVLLKLGEPRESVSCIRVTLETPLRFKFENRLGKDLPFHVLVRIMLRRISSLLVGYGNENPDLDYKGLVQKAKNVRVADSTLQWSDWRRYSHRQERGMQMGGLAGSVTYEGEIGEFLPLLEFCARVHLGKQTTFGLGKIRVDL